MNIYTFLGFDRVQSVLCPSRLSSQRKDCHGEFTIYNHINKRLSLEQKSDTRGVKGMENKQAEGYNNVFQVGMQKETNDFYFYDLSKNFSEIRCEGAHLNPSI